VNAARSYVDVARAAGLQQQSALLDALRGLTDGPEEIFAVLGTHTLRLLILRTVSVAELRSVVPATLADRFDDWNARPWVSTESLVRGFQEVRERLESSAIPVLLLKGQYFAERLYGGARRRPQMDVDVLVKRQDARRALAILRAGGFARQTYDLHSQTLMRDGWKLDLHTCLRRAPAFRIDDGLVWEEATTAGAGGVEFRTLSDAHYLVLLGLAAFEDLGQGMAKLRQLLDLFLLLRQVDAHVDWDRFFLDRQRENLDRVLVHVFALVTEVFRADLEWPNLAAALGARADERVDATRRAALDLVFASRKHHANFEWFAGVYPGSVAAYLAWFWYAGFPANVRNLTWTHAGSHLRSALLGRAASPHRQHAAS
jgi:Uncharacterised nucleotidyltransferase